MSDNSHLTSRDTTPTPGNRLSNEELVQRELMAMMSSTSPRSGSPAPDEPIADQDGPLIPPGLVGPFLITQTTLCNELIVAHQMSIQLKLHPYQHDTIEEFVRVKTLVCCNTNSYSIHLEGSLMFHDVMLLAHICALENQISTIKYAAPPFISPPQLIVNIPANISPNW